MAVGDIRGKPPETAAVPTAAARTGPPVAVSISWVTLALLATASVASLRAAPTMAVYGLAA